MFHCCADHLCCSHSKGMRLTFPQQKQKTSKHKNTATATNETQHSHGTDVPGFAKAAGFACTADFGVHDMFQVATWGTPQTKQLASYFPSKLSKLSKLSKPTGGVPERPALSRRVARVGMCSRSTSSAKRRCCLSVFGMGVGLYPSNWRLHFGTYAHTHSGFPNVESPSPK